MKAVVVYESLWGNTASVADAIAEGIGPDAVAMPAARASAHTIDGADLLVAGAPLLGFDLPTDQIRESIRTTRGAGPAPDMSSGSMRHWVEMLAPGTAAFTTFETRIWWSPGSSAKKMARIFAAKGFRAAAPSEKFLVTGRYGPLKEGEVQRARAWGAALARLVD